MRNDTHDIVNKNNLTSISSFSRSPRNLTTSLNYTNSVLVLDEYYNNTWLCTLTYRWIGHASPHGISHLVWHPVGGRVSTTEAIGRLTTRWAQWLAVHHHFGRWMRWMGVMVVMMMRMVMRVMLGRVHHPVHSGKGPQFFCFTVLKPMTWWRW